MAQDSNRMVVIRGVGDVNSPGADGIALMRNQLR